jgi:hypothetical protein
MIMRISNLVRFVEDKTLAATASSRSFVASKLEARRERKLDRKAEELAEIQRRAEIIRADRSSACA